MLCVRRRPARVSQSVRNGTYMMPEKASGRIFEDLSSSFRAGFVARRAWIAVSQVRSS